MNVSRILIHFYEGPVSAVERMYLQNFDADGQLLETNYEVYWIPGVGWQDTPAFNSLRALYESGTRLYFWGGLYYLDAVGAPVEADFAALPPKRWLLERHPFNPLPDFAINQHESFADFPATGFSTALELKTDGETEWKAPYAWDLITGRYWPVGHSATPRTSRQDYAYTADQHVTLRRPASDGADAGRPVGGTPPLDLDVPTDAGIPVERMAVRDLSYNFSGLVANEDLKVTVGASLLVVHDSDADDAAWSDGQSGQPTLYQFYIALAIVNPDDLLDFTLIDGQDLSGAVVGGATNVRRIEFPERTVTVPSGKMLRLACLADRATSELRYSRGFTVRSGELRVSLFETPDVPVEVREVTAYDGVEVTGDDDEQILTFDFDTPIDLNNYPIGRFTFEYHRDVHFKMQRVFDLREVDLAANAVEAGAAAIETDYAKHLWVNFYPPQRDLLVFSGNAWSGFQDTEVRTRIVPYGDSGYVRGCVMKVWRRNVGATITQKLVCARP